MKSFDEIYNELYTSKHEKLEKTRKIEANKVKSNTNGIITIFAGIIAVILLLLIFVFGVGIFYQIKNGDEIAKQDIDTIIKLVVTLFVVLPIGILVCNIIQNKPKGAFNEQFKKDVMEKFIKECDSNLEFYPKEGISSTMYSQAGFERYDLLFSEDLIQGKLENKYDVMMSEVTTKEEYADLEGQMIMHTKFHGIFCKCESAKFIPGIIKIKSDKGSTEKKLDKIEMDSREFENEFDVYGIDKIITMQLLTADVMETLVEFKKQSNIKYELTISNQAIYIRFHTKDIFESDLLKDSLNYDMLKKYYDIIKFTLNVAKKMNKAIEVTEI